MQGGLDMRDVVIPRVGGEIEGRVLRVKEVI